jgi:hypothetical protein
MMSLLPVISVMLVERRPLEQQQIGDARAVAAGRITKALTTLAS